MAAYHLIIKGKVQGVFYRVSARKEAEKAGLTGWVKNTLDGDVEIKINGEENQLQLFIAWCRKGPRDAQVTEVIIKPTLEEKIQGFTIERD